MGCKEELEAYLRESKVPFQAQHHAVAYTAQEVAAAEHIPGRMLAKVVMVLGDGKLSMLVLPAPSRVDLDKAAVALGAKEVRLGHEDLSARPVYVDRPLAEDETIVFAVGTHTDTMSMKYADFERLVKPQPAEFARQPEKPVRPKGRRGGG